MRKLVISFFATAAILAAGAAAYQADAQTARGADIATQAKNFTPIEKAACGPHWGRWWRAVPSPRLPFRPLLMRALLSARVTTQA